MAFEMTKEFIKEIEKELESGQVRKDRILILLFQIIADSEDLELIDMDNLNEGENRRMLGALRGIMAYANSMCREENTIKAADTLRKNVLKQKDTLDKYNKETENIDKEIKELEGCEEKIQVLEDLIKKRDGLKEANACYKEKLEEYETEVKVFKEVLKSSIKEQNDLDVTEVFTKMDENIRDNLVKAGELLDTTKESLKTLIRSQENLTGEE